MRCVYPSTLLKFAEMLLRHEEQARVRACVRYFHCLILWLTLTVDWRSPVLHKWGSPRHVGQRSFTQLCCRGDRRWTWTVCGGGRTSACLPQPPWRKQVSHSGAGGQHLGHSYNNKDKTRMLLTTTEYFSLRVQLRSLSLHTFGAGGVSNNSGCHLTVRINARCLSLWFIFLHGLHLKKIIRSLFYCRKIKTYISNTAQYRRQ